jgi:hypothetical protein
MKILSENHYSRRKAVLSRLGLFLVFELAEGAEKTCRYHPSGIFSGFLPLPPLSGLWYNQALSG